MQFKIFCNGLITEYDYNKINFICDNNFLQQNLIQWNSFGFFTRFLKLIIQHNKLKKPHSKLKL